MKKITFNVPFSNQNRTVFLLLLAVLLVVTGCATGYRDNDTGPGDLQKKVALAVFENRTFINSDDFNNSFQKQLTAKITKSCAGTWLITSGDSDYPGFLKQLPRLASGRIDNFTLTTAARTLGFNAIIVGSLLDLKIDEEPHGFLWFNDTRLVAEPVVRVEVYDTETGAKLLDDRLEHKIEINDSGFESLRAKKGNIPETLQKMFPRMADDIGESICDRINKQPWQGYIIAVRQDKIIISSGKKTGLLPGDILEVYDSGRLAKGFDGHRFFIPGPKIGKIKITAVNPNRSEAVIVSGKAIKVGSAVKSK